ncbi:hypothetical protein BGZ76_001217 [Entomortierella beljakovae]|nr:hypothetical protein BGZ76_001217 [Entomortierella beljakovae]
MNPVLVLGQKINENSTAPLKTVLLCLYGIQGIAWCISVICLLYLRLASSRDPTLGFDIQNPKRKSRAHSLMAQQRNVESFKRNNTRPNQLFLNMGQATVAPDYSQLTYEQEKVKGTITSSHSGQSHEMQPISYRIERPLAACTGEEEEAEGMDNSNNSGNVFYLPKGSRVSQVVVKFRDDSDDTLLERTGAATLVKENNYDLGDMGFGNSGESLSDIIFKAVEPLQSEATWSSDMSEESSVAKDSLVRVSNESEITDGDTKAESPSLSAISTLDDVTIPDQENGVNYTLKEPCELSKSPEILGKSLDQQQQQQQQQQQKYHYRYEPEDNENTHTPTPTRNNLDYPIVPERRSSINCAPLPGMQTPANGLSRLYRIGDEEESESEMDGDDHIYDRGDYPGAAPCMQPNTSDPHHFASEIVNIKHPSVNNNNNNNNNNNPQTNNFSAMNNNCEQSHLPASKSKPTLASLQYWRNKNNVNNNNNNNSNNNGNSTTESPACNISSPTSPSAFSFVSNFAKKKKQIQIPCPVPLVPELVIPTIVLHPDDGDGEPIRILSESDIEYLITMPPVKLMTVEEREREQELENGYEVYDDEYYDDEYNDGYDYYDYQQRYMYSQEDDEEEGVDEVEEEEEVGEEEDIGEEYEQHHMSPIRTSIEGEYDPYALDVPINLEIDLQGLEQGDLATAY